MCTTTYGEVLYVHKNDSNTRIMLRSFGCGATDSAPNSISVCKVEYYTPLFIRSTRIDTKKIDKRTWVAF